jgi:hypothetical protein
MFWVRREGESVREAMGKSAEKLGGSSLYLKVVRLILLVLLHPLCKQSYRVSYEEMGNMLSQQLI